MQISTFWKRRVSVGVRVFLIPTPRSTFVMLSKGMGDNAEYVLFHSCFVILILVEGICEAFLKIFDYRCCQLFVVFLEFI